MESLENLTKIKNATLDQVDQAEKRFKRMPLICAIVEGSLLLVYLALMDFHQRLHWLILVAALLTYATLAAGLVTMGAYINLSTQRIIKAIELGGEQRNG